MTTYTWPTSAKLIPQAATLRIINNNRSNASAESGVTQTLSRPGGRWGWALDFGAMRSSDRAEIEGFVARLNGLEHRVSLYDWKRQHPRGTCNTSGVTLSSTASALATSVVLKDCGAGTTLLAGDWIKFANAQLCMVVEDATANGSGVMTAQIRHALRSSVSSGSAVTLVQPTALYVLTESTLSLPRLPGPVEPGFSLEFIEVFS